MDSHEHHKALNIFERCEATGHVHEVLNTADWKEYLPQPLHSVMGRLSLVYGLCGSYMVGSVIRHNDVYCFLEHLMFMWTGQAIFQHINCGMLCFLCVLWNHFSLVELVQVHTELTEHPTTVYYICLLQCQFWKETMLKKEDNSTLHYFGSTATGV